MSNLIAWIIRAIPFGTIIMFGSMAALLASPAPIFTRKIQQIQRVGYV